MFLTYAMVAEPRLQSAGGNQPVEAIDQSGAAGLSALPFASRIEDRRKLGIELAR